MSIGIGTRLGHYEIVGSVGAGGMGIVYAAVDTRLGRRVAIKVLPPDAIADDDRRRRFVREARAASALNHPHIVTIYEVDEEAGTTFIAMELVDGTPLDRVIAGGPLPVPGALDYAVQIAEALEAAHRSGIVHRDIKPSNIMITAAEHAEGRGRVKVLDFGLAKLVERDPSMETRTALETRMGVVLGTGAYMSPEQAEGRRVDARSDIFSFGAVVYEMLTGRRAFSGASILGALTSILKDTPPSVRSTRPEIPREVDTIVQRALAKSADVRYLSAHAMRVDLAAVLAALTRPRVAVWRRPSVLVPVSLVLAVIVAVGAWQTVQARGARWAREEAIPEMERTQGTSRTLEIVRLARRAERYAPEDVARVRQAWQRFVVHTDP
ncbi:MAG TPA: serine/threonine-protein kinase, partial [Vicinamibacterales bacterium]|nr:serine/threonine-protein kinase [Vicinamibacterales bacterium]